MTSSVVPSPPAPPGPGGDGLPSALSLASMACGLVGLVLTLAGLGLLPSIGAVVTGHLARSRDPQARAFWLTGLVSGYVGIALSVVISIIVIVALIAFLVTVSGALAYSTLSR